MSDLYHELIECVGVQKGDVIDVASDLFSLVVLFAGRNEKFDPDKLLDALCDVVGQEGTVLIRAFNWDFCHDTPFDISKSPSRVGGLGNVAMKRPDFKRTRHPLYSWWVWGRDAEMLVQAEYTDSFSDESVFGYLERVHGYQLSLGNTHPELTFIHRAEQLVGWDFRFTKYFTGLYIDENGVESTRTYSMFVRDLSLKQVRHEFEILEPRLIAQGLMREHHIDRVRVKKIMLAEATQLVCEDMKSGAVKEYYWYVPIEESTQ